MKHTTKELEQGALLYAQKELSDLTIGATFIGSDGSTFYFEPQYKPSLVSSTGDIHLITYKAGQYGVTYSREEIERVSDVLF
ncbi:MAG: hypothetical protein J6N92_01545 [Alloprevotella sp.]|nr:hypothetical protein [Alloprevotella sp.]